VSFWELSTGDSAVSTDKEFDAGGGDFEVLPKGTSVLCTVNDVAWKSVYQRDEKFVNVKWQVLKPEAYAGRVIFQKLFVSDNDPNTPPDKMPAKRDKHKKMLMAIDANGKGRLAKITSAPDDEELALALINSQAVLTLGVWDKDDGAGGKTPGGNWVQAVKPKSAPVTEVAKKAPPKRAVFADDLDDEVPF